MIIVNFKTYKEACGENAVKLAEICYQVSKESNVEIIIGLQAADIYRVSSQVDIPVFGQHIDAIEPGKNTGFTTAFALKNAGAKGIFLNHSEHPIADFEQLKQSVDIARNEGLKILIFTKDLQQAKKIDGLKPDYLALEEPSLVSKTAMTHYPKFLKVIKDFSRQIKSLPILGAGIRTKEDVKAGLSLGIKGIAFASEFIRAENKHQLLLDFASCFQ